MNKIKSIINRINITKSRIFLVFPIFIAVLLFIYYLFDPSPELKDSKAMEASSVIQEGIAKEIIRFHVLANSDSDEDQALKLKVKNAVVEGLKEPLEEAENIEEARNIVNQNISLVTQIALNIIKEEGYDYGVNVNLSDTYFPTKIYGDMTFPPGIYEALRIEIGEAKGKNWWCVMFPPLCFVDGTYSVVPEKSKEQLKYVLTEDEYASLAKEGKLKVKAKFKVQEVMKEWLDKK